MDSEEGQPRKSADYEIGSDLSTFSVSELKELVEALKDEIARIEKVAGVKETSRMAADSVFKI